MKDKRGLYYYPFSQNKRVKMYVQEINNEISFRMWNEDDPMLWEEHGWVDYTAIQHATSMYKGGTFDPKMTYDLELAKETLKG